MDPMMATALEAPARPPHGGERAAHYVHANGLWQHVLEYGDGDGELCIVLLPGMTAAAATWDAIALAMPAEARTFVIDTRGRGLSDHPPSGFTLDDYAADLAGVIERLRLVRPVLVGHSMGARIAAAFDVAYPGRAGGLVLVDPPLSGPARPPYPSPLEMYQSFFAVAQGPEPSIDAYRELEPGLTDSEAVQRIRWLRASDLHAIEESHRGFHEESFHDLYAQLTAKAVLVHGDRTAVVTASDAQELREMRADIPVIVVDNAGHLVPQDNLEGFSAVVAAFCDNGATPVAKGTP